MSHSLLDQLKTSITPQHIADAARTIGESPESTKEAIEMALPALLSGVASTTSMPSGLSAVLRLIEDPVNDGTLATRLSSLYEGTMGASPGYRLGSQLLHAIFANRLSQTTQVIAALSGMKPAASASLVDMLAPHVLMVLGASHRAVVDHTPSGFAHFMSRQNAGLSLPPALAEVFGAPVFKSAAAIAAAATAASSQASSPSTPSAHTSGTARFYKPEREPTPLPTAASKSSEWAATPVHTTAFYKPDKEPAAIPAAAAAASEWAATPVRSTAFYKPDKEPAAIPAAAAAASEWAATPVRSTTFYKPDKEPAAIPVAAAAASEWAATPVRSTAFYKPDKEPAAIPAAAAAASEWAATPVRSTAFYKPDKEPAAIPVAAASSSEWSSHEPDGTATAIAAPPWPSEPAAPAPIAAAPVAAAPVSAAHVNQPSLVPLFLTLFSFGLLLMGLNHPEPARNVAAKSVPASEAPAAKTVAATQTPGPAKTAPAPQPKSAPAKAAAAATSTQTKSVAVAAVPAPAGVPALPPPPPGTTTYFGITPPTIESHAVANPDYPIRMAAAIPQVIVSEDLLALSPPGVTSFFGMTPSAPEAPAVFNPEYQPAVLAAATLPVVVMPDHLAPSPPGVTTFFGATPSRPEAVAVLNPEYAAGGLSSCATSKQCLPECGCGTSPTAASSLGVTTYFGPTPPTLEAAAKQNADYQPGTPPATDDTLAVCQGEVTKAVASGVVHFHSARAELTAESLGTLQRVAGAFQSCPGLRLRIEGHTDDTGGAEMNMELSEARAKAVASYLMSKGVDAARLTPAGFGMTRPLAPNSSAANKALNRRIEFIVDKL